jgi:hypothetical protein
VEQTYAHQKAEFMRMVNNRDDYWQGANFADNDEIKGGDFQSFF